MNTRVPGRGWAEQVGRGRRRGWASRRPSAAGRRGVEGLGVEGLAVEHRVERRAAGRAPGLARGRARASLVLEALSARPRPVRLGG